VAADPAVLAQRADVKLIPDTELMTLTVRDTTPQRAADLANAITKVFPTVQGTLLDDPYFASKPTLYVVEAARPSSVPVSPNIPRTMLLAAIVGALVAVAGGFLYDYFNDRISSRSRIEQLTGLSTIASIGRIDGAEPADKLVVPGKTALPIAEAYRMVRGHVQGLVNGRPVEALTITSAVPQEGKSLTAANLAIAMAQTGKRVILVDADLRRPSLHRFFRRTNTRGVTTALLRHGGDAAAEHLAPTDIENLTLMPAGPVIPNAVSYLGSPRMAELIEELKGQADLLIFDTPSLLSVVDGQIIAGLTDASLLVVRANTTRDEQLQQAVGELLDVGVTILGVVLNEAPAGKAYADYYSGTGQEEAIELIDFTRAVNDRQADGRTSRKTEK
jgi:non-specific protein-tyrosine kinase